MSLPSLTPRRPAVARNVASRKSLGCGIGELPVVGPARTRDGAVDVRDRGAEAPRPRGALRRAADPGPPLRRRRSARPRVLRLAGPDGRARRGGSYRAAVRPGGTSMMRHGLIAALSAIAMAQPAQAAE